MASNDQTVQMIVAQTGCSSGVAEKALQDVGGDLVSAIVKISAMSDAEKRGDATSGSSDAAPAPAADAGGDDDVDDMDDEELLAAFKAKQTRKKELRLNVAADAEEKRRTAAEEAKQAAEREAAKEEEERRRREEAREEARRRREEKAAEAERKLEERRRRVQEEKEQRRREKEERMRKLREDDEKIKESKQKMELSMSARRTNERLATERAAEVIAAGEAPKPEVSEEKATEAAAPVVTAAEAPPAAESGRPCAECGVARERSQYSKSQWSKGVGNGRCKTCIEGGGSAAPIAAAAAAAPAPAAAAAAASAPSVEVTEAPAAAAAAAAEDKEESSEEVLDEPTNEEDAALFAKMQAASVNLRRTREELKKKSDPAVQQAGQRKAMLTGMLGEMMLLADLDDEELGGGGGDASGLSSSEMAATDAMLRKLTGSSITKRDNKKLRVGIIGAGANCRKQHIPKLGDIDDVVVCAVANRSKDSAAKVCREFGIETPLDDAYAVLDDESIDAVVIGTWPVKHREYTVAALERGKHVLCEARMAMNADEAREMLRASQAHPELVAQLVPSPMTLKMDATVVSSLERVGRVLYVDACYSPGAFVDSDAPLHWRDDREKNGNNCMMLGVVYEALLRWFPEGVRDVFAVGTATVPARRCAERGEAAVPITTPNLLDVTGRLVRDGAQYRIHQSVVCGLVERNEVHIYGEQATMLVDMLKGEVSLGARGDPILLPVLIRPKTAIGWRVEEEFVGAIRQQEPVRLTTFAAGVEYMRFTDAVQESLQTQRRVLLNVSDEELKAEAAAAAGKGGGALASKCESLGKELASAQKALETQQKLVHSEREKAQQAAKELREKAQRLEEELALAKVELEKKGAAAAVAAGKSAKADTAPPSDVVARSELVPLRVRLATLTSELKAVEEMVGALSK